jgi:hypothetical protein
MKQSLTGRMKQLGTWFLGPLVGSLVLVMMMGKGNLVPFVAYWVFIFALFAMGGYLLTWHRLKQESPSILFFDPTIFNDPSQTRFFLGFLGVPMFIILANMFPIPTRLWPWILLIFGVSLGGVIFPNVQIFLRKATTLSWRSLVVSAAASILVVAAVVASFSLRVRLLNRGLPYEYYWDEPRGIANALRMFRDGDLDPRWFIYPSFMVYVQWISVHFSYAFLRLARWIGSARDIVTGLDMLRWIDAGSDYVTEPEVTYFWTISHSFFWYFGRLVHALLSCVSLVFIFFTGKKLQGYWAGIFAMGFLAFNSFYIDLSTWISVDILAAFNSCLWALCLVQIEGEKPLSRKRAWYWVTSMAAGLTISTKYNTIPIIVPTLLVPLWDPDLRKGLPLQSVMLKSVLFSLLGFFVATPYAVFDFFVFVNGLTSVFQYYAVIGQDVYAIRSFPEKFAYDFNFLKGQFGYGGIGPWIMIFSLPVGLIWDKVRGKKCSYFALIMFYPVLYEIFMGKMIVSFERNLLLIVPFISLAVGYWLAEVQDLLLSPIDSRLFNCRAVSKNVAGLVLIFVLFKADVEWAWSSFHGFKLHGEDTRTLVMNEVKKELLETNGFVWIVKESMIHPEEVHGVASKFLFLGAEEALQKLQTDETKPYLIVTSELDDYAPSIIEANKKLIEFSEVMKSQGEGQVGLKHFAVNPRVYVLRPRNSLLMAPLYRSPP